MYRVRTRLGQGPSEGWVRVQVCAGPGSGPSWVYFWSGGLVPCEVCTRWLVRWVVIAYWCATPTTGSGLGPG